MHANKRLTLLAVSALFLGAASPAPAIDGDGATAGPTEEATVEEAIRFRQAFGFPADLATVQSARLDEASYSDEPYGVPLSDAEVAEMLRRAEVQRALDPVVDKVRASDNFAGAYIDQPAGGVPVFLFTDADAAAERLIAAELPKGTAFRVETAARTEKELLDLKAQMEDDLAELEEGGIEIVRIGMRASRNTLFIGVQGLTPTIQRTLAERYGPGLITFEDTVKRADVCDATNNCRPIKGGISINHDGGAVGECTSGFVVRRLDTNGVMLLTAGHCIHVHGGWDQMWEHNNNGFGRARYETWAAGGTGDADVGLTTIFSDDLLAMTNKNQIRRANGSVRNVVGYTYGNIEGEQACRVGHTSGHDCGVVTDFPVGNWSVVPSGTKMWVRDTATVNFDSLGGDSGGPVFYYFDGSTSGPTVSALGTHVHSEDGAGANEGWFSPIVVGSDDYLADANYGYRPCLNAACTN